MASHDHLSLEPNATSAFKSESAKFAERGRKVNTPLATARPMNYRRRHARKTLVLCFDGTGNKFHGDASDSNILKIFRMLDRSGSAFHYYQPGIGTYVTSQSLSTSSSLQKLKEWYMKAKDSAVGSSFDHHVVGGYKFLMNYYTPGDDIYMFGFSRGSYTARFLAEMLDWVGLITHGNEEMIQFAWRTFSKWKAINSYSEEAMKSQEKAYKFMVSFRETFSRPVRRIRFLGLFDTVNSVPRFENAMMSRPLMPYTAKSSAKVIRHAVSIDERRAKFRSDLISDEGRRKKETAEAKEKHMLEKSKHHEHIFHPRSRYKNPSRKVQGSETASHRDVFRKNSMKRKEPIRYRRHSHSRSSTSRERMSADGGRVGDEHSDGEGRMASDAYSDLEDSSDSDGSDQDIDELWFPGGHADIGGGWEDASQEQTALSHVPLAWIVREASNAGLVLDEEKVRAMGCWDDAQEALARAQANVPKIEISGLQGEQGDLANDDSGDKTPRANGETKEEILTAVSNVEKKIIEAATGGRIHDCLEYGHGLPSASVFSWRIMEYIPFRRMDLQQDGSWKPIRWPLPRGEVRDMPSNAKVHHSAIRRMEYNSNYRPGNLIVGGGGRGTKIAPKNMGIGEWRVVAEEGNIIGERYVRVARTEEK